VFAFPPPWWTNFLLLALVLAFAVLSREHVDARRLRATPRSVIVALLVLPSAVTAAFVAEAATGSTVLGLVVLAVVSVALIGIVARLHSHAADR
jgi:uncharacterized membrane protein YhaH (DUF805 family)